MTESMSRIVGVEEGVESNTEYEDHLQKLRDRIEQMGACVANMIAGSVRALVERDGELARHVMELDRRVDRFQVEMDDISLGLLARHQPVASDLRFITTGLKLVTELERIGDLCVNICERALERGSELDGEAPLTAWEDLPWMGDAAQEMICELLQAFIDSDPERARQVIERDRDIDAHYEQCAGKLLAVGRRDSAYRHREAGVHAAARHLERIGDDVTSLAEMVVLMATAGTARASAAPEVSADARTITRRSRC